jgi:hypothetical protein
VLVLGAKMGHPDVLCAAVPHDVLLAASRGWRDLWYLSRQEAHVDVA